MSFTKTKYKSATAVIDWHNLKASGEPLENGASAVVIRTERASRIAVGVADPLASAIAGIPTEAGVGTVIVLGAGAAAQNIWVQSAADQLYTRIEIDVLAKTADAVYV